MVAKSFRRIGLAGALPLIAAAAALAPGIAFADTAPPRAVVRTADLDLTTPAGVAALDHRLHRAVTAVCPMQSVDVASVVAREKCTRAAWNGIAPQRGAMLAAAERRAGQSAVAVADIKLPATDGSAHGL